MSTEGGTKAVIAAMIANGGIAITKFGAFRPPDPARCSPRRSTRWPTRATRGCCSSAASGRCGPRTPTTSSATAARATSTRSWWRSSSSCSAACSPCTRDGTRSSFPEPLDEGLDRLHGAVHLDPARVLVVPDRASARRTSPVASEVAGRYIQRHSPARAARRADGGPGALIGLCFALFGVSMAESDRRCPLGRGRRAVAIGTCWWSSRCSWPSRCRPCSSASPPCPRRRADPGRALQGQAGDRLRHPHAHPAHRTGRAARRRQDRDRPRLPRRGPGPDHRRGRGADPRRAADRALDLHRARHRAGAGARGSCARATCWWHPVGGATMGAPTVTPSGANHRSLVDVRRPAALGWLTPGAPRAAPQRGAP